MAGLLSNLFLSQHNLLLGVFCVSEPLWEGSSSQLAAGAAQLVALEHMCASENSKSAVNTLGAAATIHLKEVLCVFK